MKRRALPATRTAARPTSVRGVAAGGGGSARLDTRVFPITCCDCGERLGTQVFDNRRRASGKADPLGAKLEPGFAPTRLDDRCTKCGEAENLRLAIRHAVFGWVAPASPEGPRQVRRAPEWVPMFLGAVHGDVKP